MDSPNEKRRQLAALRKKLDGWHAFKDAAERIADLFPYQPDVYEDEDRARLEILHALRGFARECQLLAFSTSYAVCKLRQQGKWNRNPERPYMLNRMQFPHLYPAVEAEIPIGWWGAADWYADQMYESLLLATMDDIVEADGLTIKNLKP